MCRVTEVRDRVPLRFCSVVSILMVSFAESASGRYMVPVVSCLNRGMGRVPRRVELGLMGVS